MLASFEGCLDELEMGVGRGGDDDDVQVRVGEERVNLGVVLDIGMVVRGRVALPRTSLDDAVKLELGRGGYKGDVEDFG